MIAFRDAFAEQSEASWKNAFVQDNGEEWRFG
jgi:hypothetical protein